LIDRFPSQSIKWSTDPSISQSSFDQSIDPSIDGKSTKNGYTSFCNPLLLSTGTGAMVVFPPFLLFMGGIIFRQHWLHLISMVFW